MLSEFFDLLYPWAIQSINTYRTSCCCSHGLIGCFLWYTSELDSSPALVVCLKRWNSLHVDDEDDLSRKSIFISSTETTIRWINYAYPFFQCFYTSLPWIISRFFAQMMMIFEINIPTIGKPRPEGIIISIFSFNILENFKWKTSHLDSNPATSRIQYDYSNRSAFYNPEIL